MPIPSYGDGDAIGDRRGIATNPPIPLVNRLRTSTLIHYVQPGTGTHLSLMIGSVHDMTTGEISVSVPDASRPAGQYTQCNVKYDDQSKPQWTWHFPSDG